MVKNNESIILTNEDFYCKNLVIGLSIDDSMAEVNAFDWMEKKQKPIEMFSRTSKSVLSSLILKVNTFQSEKKPLRISSKELLSTSAR